MRDSLRGLHFHMTDSQRHRLHKAQELLTTAPGGYHSTAFVNIADVIRVENESTVLRGHGTQQIDGQILATLCGVVQRVDQLITVKPLRARYNAETGDVLVGRITEVGAKRWKVDINFRQDAHLMLSAVNLPGGIQRRRTVVDELNMRTLYEENDLISAEVQSVHSDGSVHLHTRSLKYGKLENGQLIKVDAYLVKRLKQHFHTLSKYGVDMIIGCNGYIWIAAQLSDKGSGMDIGGIQSAASTDLTIGGEVTPMETDTFSGDGHEEMQPISLQVRENICRLSNSVRVLAALGFMLTPDTILDTYEASISMGLAIKDMLGAEFAVCIAETEVGRRTKRLGAV